MGHEFSQNSEAAVKNRVLCVFDKRLGGGQITLGWCD